MAAQAGEVTNVVGMIARVASEQRAAKANVSSLASEMTTQD